MVQKSHIYFLVNKSHDAFKIGLALNPLRRWAQIQPHAHTDFAESLVFDIAAGGSAAWAEMTLHRALMDARLSMPSEVAGHTEWFNYSAFDTARALAHKHRSFLGISEGYAISVPSTPNTAPVIKRGGVPRSIPNSAPRSILSEQFPDDPTSQNEEVVSIVETRVPHLIASGSLLGSAAGDESMKLYFRRNLISAADLNFHPHNDLYSTLVLPSGKLINQTRTPIFRGMLSRGEYIRLSVAHPFYLTKSLDTIVSEDYRRHGRTETWAQTTPGVERLRSAIGHLVASAPALPPGHPATALESRLYVHF